MKTIIVHFTDLGDVGEFFNDHVQGDLEKVTVDCEHGVMQIRCVDGAEKGIREYIDGTGMQHDRS